MISSSKQHALGSDAYSMELNTQRITTREKLILVGLYLSKYDSVGLNRLGFSTFAEAFNAFGYALGAKPASIKNYRDEFDPLFPNQRQGWHNRKTRIYCLKVFENYRGLDLESFTALIESFVGFDENAFSEIQHKKRTRERQSNFAQRLITGLAAERYFEAVRPTLSQFEGYGMQNTTSLGCGYDFRLEIPPNKDFLVVEVKGLNGTTGSLSLTPKEYEIARTLNDRFFLFVVKNFKESPFHEIFQNPLSSGLKFKKKERLTVQVSWLANV